MNKVFKIFIDFDGTITKEDVGEAIFNKFGKPDVVNKIIVQLLNGEISAKQCWLSLCRSVENLTKERLDKFIESLEIEPTFRSLIDYCSNNNIEFYILSDGFDYYIDRILAKEHLPGIKTYSNKLTITEDNRLVPSFPYHDSNCSTSANCKRNHIITHSGDEEYTVYIGDGNSDKDTIQFCDFIFAKDDLLKYCEKERISYFPFNNFNDVISRLNILISKKKLKKRHQAELKRKEVYMQE